MVEVQNSGRMTRSGSDISIARSSVEAERVPLSSTPYELPLSFQAQPSIYAGKTTRTLLARLRWPFVFITGSVILATACYAIMQTHALTTSETANTYANQAADDVRARRLLSEAYSGLNPEYEVDQSELRFKEGESDHSAKNDFRKIHFAREASPRGGSYEGFQCGSHYPGKMCPLPGQCAPAAKGHPAIDVVREKGQCIHWETGRLAHPISISQTEVDRARSKQAAFSPNWEGEGIWTGSEWKPEQKLIQKKYRFFSPQAMHQCFAGKRILIQGDSMMRQLYNRLIHYTREIPVSCTTQYVKFY